MIYHIVEKESEIGQDLIKYIKDNGINIIDIENFEFVLIEEIPFIKIKLDEYEPMLFSISSIDFDKFKNESESAIIVIDDHTNDDYLIISIDIFNKNGHSILYSEHISTIFDGHSVDQYYDTDHGPLFIDFGTEEKVKININGEVIEVKKALI